MRKPVKSPGNNKPSGTAPWMLFGIGFTAGVCATLFPRLAPLITRAADINLRLLHVDYLIAALVFSAIIGVVMMWFHWGTHQKPQTLFMAALGIPSLLSSSFNMSDSTEIIRQQQQQQQRLEKSIEEFSGIEILNEGAPAKVKGGGVSSLSRDLGPDLWDYLGVARVHAADAQPNAVNFNPRIQTQNQEGAYVVVLASAPKQEQLLGLQRTYQQREIPGLKIIKTDDTYYLVAGARHRTKAGALYEALSLKEKTGLKKVKLLQVE